MQQEGIHRGNVRLAPQSPANVQHIICSYFVLHRSQLVTPIHLMYIVCVSLFGICTMCDVYLVKVQSQDLVKASSL